MESGDDRKSLSTNQKRVLSKLYKIGDAIERNESHYLFQVECLQVGLQPKYSVFQRRMFLGAKENLDKASKEVIKAARDFFKTKLYDLKTKLVELKSALERVSTVEEFESLMERFLKSMKRKSERLKKKK